MTTSEQTVNPLPADKRIGLAMAEALDALWTKIQGYHPDMPEVVLFVSPVAHGMDTDRYQVLGHFGADRWRVPGQDAAIGEVLLVAEQMMRGPEALLETVLHEGAHALASARKVEDTSQNGRYHNAGFRGIAEELGLDVEQQGGRGWAATSLAEGTLERYADEVVAVGKALIELDKQRPRRERKPARNGPVKVVCECPHPRVMRVSPSVFLAAPVTCGACQADFRVERPLEGEDADGEE
jgi:hypothetical protein